MEAGKIAMTINGPWREQPLKKAGIDYGVAKVPTLPNGKPMVPFLGVQVFGGNAFSKNKEAALDFMKFATCTTSAITLYKGTTRCRCARARSTAPRSRPTRTSRSGTREAADGVPMPNIPAMSNVWKPWGDAMDAIIPGNAPDDQVKSLLDNAVAQIKTAISSRRSRLVSVAWAWV